MSSRVHDSRVEAYACSACATVDRDGCARAGRGQTRSTKFGHPHPWFALGAAVPPGHSGGTTVLWSLISSPLATARRTRPTSVDCCAMQALPG